MHGRDGPAVARHADEAGQPLPARLDRRFEHAILAHGLIPVVRVAERMELDEIDMIDAQTLERAMDVLTAFFRGARAGLRRQKEVLPVTRHPGSDAELGIAVARRRVDVVHAVAQEHLEGAVRVGLTRARESGGAEERDAAEMAGSTEWTPLDHSRTSRSSPEAAGAVERRAASGSISRGLSAGTAAPYLGAGVYFPVSCGVLPSSFFSCRSRRVSRPQVRLRSSRTLKRSRPSFSVSISIRSPFWKPLRPRWLVRVVMMSPGSSGWIEVTHSMQRGILWAMSLVLSFSLLSRFTLRFTWSLCGSTISSAVTIHGPIGANVSRDFI